MIVILFYLLGFLLLLGLGVLLFLNQPSFGRLPRGERQHRIERSPNFRNGEFHNRERTPLMTSHKSRFSAMFDFITRKPTGELRPEVPVPVVKTELKTLDVTCELMVWFGHSSYLIQTGGKRFLVDPVFCDASPVSFINRPFPGTNIYKPEDFPEIDYLIITHDHWDHLDYRTVKQLRNRIGKVICPLGVGEHFEYWGFQPDQLIELDWDESAWLDDGLMINCLTARHFSGRGLSSNRTLWASFLLHSPSRKIFISGDGGYGKHFAEFGRRFPDIDLAILENGQYNDEWKYIHTMPPYILREMKDLRARRLITVHHSKYALAKHPWMEPVQTVGALQKEGRFCVLNPVIGEIIPLSHRE